jgi:hypothetical protein
VQVLSLQIPTYKSRTFAATSSCVVHFKTVLKRSFRVLWCNPCLSFAASFKCLVSLECLTVTSGHLCSSNLDTRSPHIITCWQRNDFESGNNGVRRIRTHSAHAGSPRSEVAPLPPHRQHRVVCRGVWPDQDQVRVLGFRSPHTEYATSLCVQNRTQTRSRRLWRRGNSLLESDASNSPFFAYTVIMCTKCRCFRLDEVLCDVNPETGESTSASGFLDPMPRHGKHSCARCPKSVRGLGSRPAEKVEPFV